MTDGDDRIKALEKEVEDLKSMQETIVESDPVRMQGQISELKESLDKHVQCMHGYSGEKLDSKTEKKEYIASLNDPKAFEAVNLGVLKRERKGSGGDPNKCSECGGFRMGENMMHNDWCSQCTTTTTSEKLPELVLNDPCQPCEEDVECNDCHHRHPEAEPEKTAYDNDAIRYKLSRMGIIIGRPDIYDIKETKNYVILQFQGTIEIKKEVLK